ncbi:MAG: hypothetical protein D3909_10865 [Candidatus Electrothrix sp. ATG1]|nr:hypothetical protein [Candidatus Electrothrix sp. ATG1]
MIRTAVRSWFRVLHKNHRDFIAGVKVNKNFALPPLGKALKTDKHHQIYFAPERVLTYCLPCYVFHRRGFFPPWQEGQIEGKKHGVSPYFSCTARYRYSLMRYDKADDILIQILFRKFSSVLPCITVPYPENSSMASCFSHKFPLIDRPQSIK